MSNVVTFSASQIAALKARAEAHPLLRARINLHPSLSDPVQEMVICEMRDTYVRPHRHPGRVESFHVVEGLLTVVIFDDAGWVTELVPLGNFGSGALYSEGESGWMLRPVLYRQLRSVWHTVLVESDYAIVHEVVPGPFPYETEWAPWAPNANDADAAAKYVAQLRGKIK